MAHLLLFVFVSFFFIACAFANEIVASVDGTAGSGGEGGGGGGGGDITVLLETMNKGFASVNAQFASLNAQFASLNASVNAGIAHLQQSIEEIKDGIAETHLFTNHLFKVTQDAIIQWNNISTVFCLKYKTHHYLVSAAHPWVKKPNYRIMHFLDVDVAIMGIAQFQGLRISCLRDEFSPIVEIGSELVASGYDLMNPDTGPARCIWSGRVRRFLPCGRYMCMSTDSIVLTNQGMSGAGVYNGCGIVGVAYQVEIGLFQTETGNSNVVPLQAVIDLIAWIESDPNLIALYRLPPEQVVGEIGVPHKQYCSNRKYNPEPVLALA